MKLIAIFMGLAIAAAAAWVAARLWKRIREHGLHSDTVAGKLKLFGFVYSMWLVICGAIVLGLSTSALGWQVLSLWLVKPILILALILTFFTYGTLRSNKTTTT